MMMTISILVFILFLCCTVFLKGSLLGGILGMALGGWGRGPGSAAAQVSPEKAGDGRMRTVDCSCGRNGTSFSSVRTVRRKPS